MKKFLIFCLIIFCTSKIASAKPINIKETKEVCVRLDGDSYDGDVNVDYQSVDGGYVYSFTLNEKNGWCVRRLMPIGSYVCINRTTVNGVISSEDYFNLTNDHEILVSVTSREVVVADTGKVEVTEAKVNYLPIFVVAGVAAFAAVIVIIVCLKRK